MVQRRKTDARRPTLRMVAELAGVSTATVSYVFSGRAGTGGSGVAEATAARVIAAAEELNYRPNTAARAIRTGRSGMVQLSLHMLSDPWSLAVADAVNAEANKHGLTTLILADGDWHDRVVRGLAARDPVRRGHREVTANLVVEVRGAPVARRVFRGRED